MGNVIKQAHSHGIAVHDEMVSADHYSPDVSSCTQYGPHPGPAEGASGQSSRLQLVTSGEFPADQEVEIRALRAGNPTPNDGGFAWQDKAGGDDGDDYSGQDTYHVITGWSAFDVTKTEDSSSQPHVLRLQSGKLLAVGGRENDAAGTRHVWQYDPSSSVQAWSAPIELTGMINDPSNPRSSCLVQIADGTVLLFVVTPDKIQVDVWESRDDGETWSLRANRALDAPMLDSGDGATEQTVIRAAFSSGQILLLTEYVDGPLGTRIVEQRASSDYGCTFQYVGTLSDDAVSHYSPDVCPRPGGGFCVSLCDSAANDGDLYFGQQRFIFLTLGSAYTPLADAESQAPWVSEVAALASYSWEPSPAAGSCIWLDEDGTIYYLVQLQSTSAEDARVYAVLHYSSDGGTTWEYFRTWVWASEAEQSIGSVPYRPSIASTGGLAWMVTRFGDAGTPRDNWWGVQLGGTSSHTMPVSTENILTMGFTDPNRCSWEDEASQSLNAGMGGSYLPVGTPTSEGAYTYFNGAAGGLEAVSNGRLHLQSAAGAGEEIGYLDTARRGGVAQACTKLAGEVCLKINSGGHRGRDDIAVDCRLTDISTWRVRAILRFTSTGFDVYDATAGLTRASINIDMTEYQHIRVAMECNGTSAQLLVWTRSHANGFRRQWVKHGPYGIVVDAATYVGAYIAWGHLNPNADNGAADTYWQFEGHTFIPHSWSEHRQYYNYYVLGTTPWANPQSLRPRPFSVYPSLIWNGMKLAARGGPCVVGEQWGISTAYTHPVRHLDPARHPSPRETWRSAADGSEQTIVWDREPNHTKGWTETDVLVVWLLNANIEGAYLEGRTGGAGGWTNIAYLNAAYQWGPFRYRRRGRILRPDTTQATATTQWVWSEEMVGDTVDLGAGGGDEPGERYVKVAHNTAGRIVGTGTTTLRPSLTVEDEDTLWGGDAFSGEATIWRRNFGVIIPGVWANEYDELRLRIPNHVTADGYYEIGTLFIGAVQLLPAPYDYGWARDLDIPSTSLTLPGGHRRRRREAPTRRILELGYANSAVDITNIQVGAPDPDYLAIENGGEPAGVGEATLDVLTGVWERTDGGERPVLLLPRIPVVDAGELIQESRRRAWYYGTMEGPPRIETLLGDEVSDEVETMGMIKVVEIV